MWRKVLKRMFCYQFYSLWHRVTMLGCIISGREWSPKWVYLRSSCCLHWNPCEAVKKDPVWIHFIRCSWWRQRFCALLIQNCLTFPTFVSTKAWKTITLYAYFGRYECDYQCPFIVSISLFHIPPFFSIFSSVAANVIWSTITSVLLHK